MTTEAATETRTELSKGYEHRDVEARWYRVWKDRGYFHADEDDRTRPPFSIVLPPPNVTGSLHLGHALTATLQDVLTRWKRMSGFNALWLPGTDHAGIATQMIVEKELQKTERKSRHDLGRAEFLKRVWAWKERYGSRIGEQHEALGASLDWQRERFTMDEGLSRAVREVFVRLYEEGLVYREKKLINWCPECRTALSDLEVTYDEAHQGELWSFAYPLSDGSGEIVVATTRPETMLGDTAVAVHPDDERYRALIGRKVVHPLLDREIPVIADPILVDPAFGTGAVKVTPGHDFNDFEVGKRHSLEMITVIDIDGRMNANAGPVAGLDRFEARRVVKEIIASKGLDRGTKPHVLPLGKCQRSETVLEPLLSQQWFVRIDPLARPAIEAVEQGRTRFIPESWTNTYMAWMRNIHDWCISRQLWWGHQIPAWYCPDGHVTVARAEPSACATCSKRELRQDDDVLDTWFSSALWPFSTMGWPERNATLETFYPTSVMETGHDIIFFWVARMMMMGLHFMGDVPFRVVYLHPMVRDEKGQKMSKTKGNVIDPLVITEQFGADALRFTLAALTAQGRDIKLAKERIEGYRAFANKLWNAARFALMNLGDYTVETTSRATPLPPVPEELGGAAGSRVPSSVDLPGAPSSVQLESVEVSRASAADRWILARLQRAVNDAVEALEGFRFNDFADALYQFVWHELCDWYIELAKDALYGGDLVAQARTRAVLTRCLDTSLRLLHPVMPFITEELWQTLRSQVRARWADSIMIAPFPERGALDEAAERSFGPVIGIVEALRNIRGEMNIPFKVPLRDVQLGSLADDSVATVRAEESRIARLANVEGLTIGSAPTRKLPGSAVAVGSGFEVRVPLAGVVDMAAEGARVTKELAKLETDLAGIEKKLANPNFVERAPKEVVEKDRARAEELRLKRTRLEAHRAMLLEAGQASPGEAASTSGQAAIGSERAPAQPDVVVPAATTELQPSPSAAASATVTPTAVAETARQPRPAKKSGVADEKRSKSRRAGAGDGAGKESPVRRAPRTVPGKKSEPGAMKVTGGSQKRSKAAAPKKAPAGQRQRSKAPPSRRNSKRTGSSGTASGSVSRGSETRKVNPRTMRAPSRRASSGTKGGTRGPNAKPRSRRSAPPGRRR